MKNLTGIYWIKNEARYLPEYLEFHLLQGFDHFIFYDNKSTDKTYEVLEPYGDLVEIRTYPPEVTGRHNFWLMCHCIDEQKEKSKWIHFHAIDERLFSPTGKTVIEVLEEFDKPDIGGVCVNWQQIHSGGIVKRPEGLIIENFKMAQSIDPSRHVKTIIRPDRTSSACPANPHNFYYNYNNYAVSEDFVPVSGAFNKGAYTFNKLKNIHYATLSLEEWEEKMNKGVLDHVNSADTRRPDVEKWWNYYHNNGNAECLDLISYVPVVREKIAERFKEKQDLLNYINH